ncbi:polysaccharide biosynthesis protein [Streptococcus pneumoniae]|nr:polysaccharide biosynthesis protein [Streptococcus pneumoniae]
MGAYAAKANGLFTMGYNIYAWFLLVSTAGIPHSILITRKNSLSSIINFSLLLVNLRLSVYNRKY